MKYVVLFILFFALFISSCEKDDDSQNLLDQLPEATQTGEQTFGCLIDGEPFIPDNFGSGRPNAFYQYSNGKYTFSISANSGAGVNFKGVILTGREVETLQIKNYQIDNKSSGNIFGEIMERTELYTSKKSSGTFKVTNMDPENFIISGTFEFTVFDDNGNKIEITDGRFDVKYTN